MNTIKSATVAFLQAQRNVNGFFVPITIGKYKVSVQASTHHYSSPRETLNVLNEYDVVEVAIFKGDKWVIPSEEFSFNWVGNFDNGGDTSVGRLSIGELRGAIKDISLLKLGRRANKRARQVMNQEEAERRAAWGLFTTSPDNIQSLKDEGLSTAVAKLVVEMCIHKLPWRLW